MNSLFISGNNQYGVITDMLAGMERDLSRLGISVEHLVYEEDKANPYLRLDSRHFDFVLSANAMGIDDSLLAMMKSGVPAGVNFCPN